MTITRYATSLLLKSPSTIEFIKQLRDLISSCFLYSVNMEKFCSKQTGINMPLDFKNGSYWITGYVLWKYCISLLLATVISSCTLHHMYCETMFINWCIFLSRPTRETGCLGLHVFMDINLPLYCV